MLVHVSRERLLYHSIDFAGTLSVCQLSISINNFNRPTADGATEHETFTIKWDTFDAY